MTHFDFLFNIKNKNCWRDFSNFAEALYKYSYMLPDTWVIIENYQADAPHQRYSIVSNELASQFLRTDDHSIFCTVGEYYDLIKKYEQPKIAPIDTKMYIAIQNDIAVGILNEFDNSYAYQFCETFEVDTDKAFDTLIDWFKTVIPTDKCIVCDKVILPKLSESDLYFGISDVKEYYKSKSFVNGVVGMLEAGANSKHFDNIIIAVCDDCISSKCLKTIRK
jgi:hypothetical protein